MVTAEGTAVPSNTLLTYNKSVAAFIGCFLTAYGPALAVFFLYIAKSAQLVILLISSAFYWLLSILLSSAVWYLIPSLQKTFVFHIIVGCIFQELFRGLFWLTIKKAEVGLNQVSDNPKSPVNRSKYAFASGLGFGLMSGLVTYMTQLAETLGPGILVCKSCPMADLFFISALTTCLFIFLHTMWSVVAFEALEKRQFLSIWPILSHLGASLGTLLIVSETVTNGCIYSLCLSSAILAATIVLAYRAVFSKV
ncbi:gamma-secretase subunit Aph-1 [Chytridium lagenaria]|nr:gamma-secretase subunit Aph-1 [Chytridium lagenaria]